MEQQPKMDGGLSGIAPAQGLVGPELEEKPSVLHTAGGLQKQRTIRFRLSQESNRLSIDGQARPCQTIHGPIPLRLDGQGGSNARPDFLGHGWGLEESFDLKHREQWVQVLWSRLPVRAVLIPPKGREGIRTTACAFVPESTLGKQRQKMNVSQRRRMELRQRRLGLSKQQLETGCVSTLPLHFKPYPNHYQEMDRGLDGDVPLPGPSHRHTKLLVHAKVGGDGEALPQTLERPLPLFGVLPELGDDPSMDAIIPAQP
jgi:hypothetical protein